MQDTRTTQQFLAQEVYLPGWMLIEDIDYSKDSGTFTFNPREPEVAKKSVIHYLTPRSFHVLISQATYCLIEEQAEELGFAISELRKNYLESRIKIIELYERLRRELSPSKPLQAKFDLMRFRLGKLPLAKFNFDFGNRAVEGNLIAVIAPKPTPQTNSDIMRF